jgi:uracil-DNA glycosylase
LNACLTVSANKAGSHHNKGWEPFTQSVLKAVANDASHGAKTSIKNSTIANMFSKVDPAAAKKNEVKEDKQESKAANSEATKSNSKGVVFLVWGLPAAKSLAEAGISEVSERAAVFRRFCTHDVNRCHCSI